MEQIEQAFIVPLKRVFGAPKSEDIDGYFKDLTEDLASFTTDQLKAAVRQLRQNRKFSSFPTIAECVGACRDAVEREEGTAKPHVRMPWEPKREDEAEKARIRRQACHICRCDLGRVADVEGWLPSMIEFAEQHARIPQGREIDPLRATAARHERNIEQLFDEAQRFKLPNPLGPAVLRFRKVMLDKAHRDVFEGEAARTQEQGRQGYAAPVADIQGLTARAIEVGNRPLPALSDTLRKSLGIRSKPAAESAA